MSKENSSSYCLYINDVNHNLINIETYDSPEGADSMEAVIERWLAEEHGGMWGETNYDTFNSPDNKSPESSFLEPFVTKENQPDPPEGRTDFEHLEGSEYVSRVPIPVAERIGEEVESHLTEAQKELLTTMVADCGGVDELHRHIYTGLPYVAGLPDVLAWKRDAPDNGPYKFVEVKKVDREGGYQDGLRVDQALWFSFFDYFDNYVIYIEELDPDS